MEKLCPECSSADIWNMPEQDTFGRCHRCYVVLVWSFGWWRRLSRAEWQRWPWLGWEIPWAWQEEHR